MADLRTKGEEWRARIFKMILFFGIMGMVVLCLGVALLSKTFAEILAPEPAPKPAASGTTAH
jgi:hypothetical protein